MSCMPVAEDAKRVICEAGSESLELLHCRHFVPIPSGEWVDMISACSVPGTLTPISVLPRSPPSRI